MLIPTQEEREKVQRGSKAMNKLIQSIAVAVGIAFISLVLSSSAFAESVYVKYRGMVELSPFACQWIERSSLVTRLCYDTKEKYVIVSLNGTYYHYCEVPGSFVDEWKQADSMGRFYNQQIKGQFDCRIFRVPSYR
jgi:hypothetical protein